MYTFMQFNKQGQWCVLCVCVMCVCVCACACVRARVCTPSGCNMQATRKKAAKILAKAIS